MANHTQPLITRLGKMYQLGLFSSTEYKLLRDAASTTGPMHEVSRSTGRELITNPRVVELRSTFIRRRMMGKLVLLRGLEDRLTPPHIVGPLLPPGTTTCPLSEYGIELVCNPEDNYGRL